MDLRRIEFMKAVHLRVLLLKEDPNDFGIVVPTVAFDAQHLEELDERSRLPSIHIMQGSVGTIDEGPTAAGGDLGDIVEIFPVVLRCTVKGPVPGEDENVIERKSFQAIRLRHGVEKVLVGRPGQNVLGVPGIIDTSLTTFALPQVRENWGSPWLAIEFNYHIIHTYRKGEPV